VEFLSKPIDQELLLGAVKKAVDEGRSRDKVKADAV
jgi:FixJ family two-component response regulator